LQPEEPGVYDLAFVMRATANPEAGPAAIRPFAFVAPTTR
jgi:hypothetical protein